MKKLAKRLVSAALAASMAVSVLPVSTFALGGGSDVENGVISYAASNNLMSSDLTNLGLDFYRLDSYTAGTVLSSGIYYLDADQHLTLNAPVNGVSPHKNGLAVKDGETVYLYLPEGSVLEVYGKNGADATNAGPGKDGSMTVYTTGAQAASDRLGSTLSMPRSPVDSQRGALGGAATGGGAAIYVPKNAKLIVLGSGKLEAHGGNGGKASQGNLGMNTTYWLIATYVHQSRISNNALVSYEPHGYTNDSRYENSFSFVPNITEQKNLSTGGYAFLTMAALAGAGGTGGSGAGGGGAAIGTNGTNGTVGTVGGEGVSKTSESTLAATSAVWDGTIRVKNGAIPEKLTNVDAGDIYIADTVTTTGSEEGKGGAEYGSTKAEKWNNGKNSSGTAFLGTESKYQREMIVHIIPKAGYRNWTATADENDKINVYVTNARRGGNGGAGGNGALFGQGGAGGQGGQGGDSGSVVFPILELTVNGSQVSNIGADGDAGKPGAASTTTLDSDNLPYNTITFTGVNDANPKKYYLQNSRTITVPDYTPASTSTLFKGWKVTQAATKLPTVFNETVHDNAKNLLTTTEEAVYQYGNEISTAGFYGDVVLEPVLEQKVFDITKGDYVEKVTDASGNALSAAYANQSVTVTAKNREGYELTGFTVSNADGDTTIADIQVGIASGLSGTFTMPGYAVTVKANYQKKDYDVSVSGGKLTVTDDEGNTGTETTSTTAQVENEVTFTADPAPTDRYFDRWEFTSDGQPVDVTERILEGALDEPTVKLKMPPENLTAKAMFLDVVKNDINFDGECGFARVDGKRVTAAKSGDTVTVTAAAQDKLLFDYWEMFDPDDNDIIEKLANKTSAETTFKMPDHAVTLKAYYNKPVEPGEPTQSTEMVSKGEAAGIAVAAVGVGVAVWQGSELAMRIYRDKVIQVSYWPGNRIQLAQLLWSRAGAPEPESNAPFADVTAELDTLQDTNINAQKAARWCVEQGLLDARTLDDGTECFEPAKAVSRLRVCIIWQNAKNKGLFDAQTAE